MRTDDEGPRYNEDELRSMKYWSDRSVAAAKAVEGPATCAHPNGCKNPAREGSNYCGDCQHS